MNVIVMDILDRGIECLMSTAFAIIDVFPDHSPIIKVEDLFPQYFIGLNESIKDKSISMLVPGHSKSEFTRSILLMCETFLVYPDIVSKISVQNYKSTYHYMRDFASVSCDQHKYERDRKLTKLLQRHSLHPIR
jgi:hypothetical protein